jgi:hypothetical protein
VDGDFDGWRHFFELIGLGEHHLRYPAEYSRTILNSVGTNSWTRRTNDEGVAAAPKKANVVAHSSAGRRIVSGIVKLIEDEVRVSARRLTRLSLKREHRQIQRVWPARSV